MFSILHDLHLQLPVAGASIWFEIWGARGSQFENWSVMGPKSSTNGGT